MIDASKHWTGIHYILQWHFKLGWKQKLASAYQNSLNRKTKMDKHNLIWRRRWLGVNMILYYSKVLRSWKFTIELINIRTTTCCFQCKIEALRIGTKTSESIGLSISTITPPWSSLVALSSSTCWTSFATEACSIKAGDLAETEKDLLQKEAELPTPMPKNTGPN